jgi:hypothetical protein
MKPLQGLYWGYTTHHDEREARRMFSHRFGYEPDKVEPTGGGIWAGPLRDGVEMRPGERFRVVREKPECNS